MTQQLFQIAVARKESNVFKSCSDFPKRGMFNDYLTTDVIPTLKKGDLCLVELESQDIDGGTEWWPARVKAPSKSLQSYPKFPNTRGSDLGLLEAGPEGGDFFGLDTTT